MRERDRERERERQRERERERSPVCRPLCALFNPGKKEKMYGLGAVMGLRTDIVS